MRKLGNRHLSDGLAACRAAFTRRMLPGLAVAVWATMHPPGAIGQVSGEGDANGGVARRADDFGIVINQTFTSIGQEFYRRFTDFWREKPDFESYTLLVLERPSVRYGNRIIVSHGQNVVFSGNLPAKADAVRALSADAAEKAYANIIASSLRINGERDPDIGRDEI